MPLTEAQIEEILPNIMEYDPTDVEIDGIESPDNLRMKANISLGSAPRCAKEFFCDHNDDLIIDVTTSSHDSDNAPTDSVVRMGVTLTREDMKECDILPGYEHDIVTIILAGHLSCPDYSDDENDGYFYGRIYVQAGDHEWAEEESLKESLDNLEQSVETMMRRTIEQISTMRLLGKETAIAKAGMAELARQCLKAA